MDNFLNDAFDTYTQATAKSPNVWVTVYPDPGGKDSLLYAGEGEPGEQWHFIENTINKNLKFFKRFSIRVARPIKEGASAKNAQAVLIKVVYEPFQAQPQQVAGIGAVQGVYGYGQADIGAIEKRIEEKFEARMAHEKILREKDDEIAGLKYENMLKKKKGDFWEKATVFCNENQVDVNQIVGQIMPIISGVLSKIVMPSARATPALAGRPRPGTTHVHHHEANTEVPAELEADEPDTDEGQPLTDDDYRALDALDMLKAAGAADPAGILEKVAKFYQSNPAMAEGFINQYLPS